MTDLVYPELSYKIVGLLFEIYNELGGGYQEKYYQRAVALALKKAKITYKEQLLVPLSFNGTSIGRYFVDFIIDDKIVLELKINPIFYKRDINQVLAYLKSSSLKLAILASFTRTGLKFQRVLKGKN